MELYGKRRDLVHSGFEPVLIGDRAEDIVLNELSYVQATLPCNQKAKAY